MTLDEKIASALTTETTSEAIAALIEEAERTAAEAEEGIEADRDRALDPLSSGEEAVRAREALTAALFTRDRLNTALPRIRAKLVRAKQTEYAARWEADYERVRAKRDEVAGELAEHYPGAAARLIDLFRRVQEADKEVEAINSRAPGGDGRRLQHVERHALGMPNGMWNESPLIDRVQLPVWSGGSEIWLGRPITRRWRLTYLPAARAAARTRAAPPSAVLRTALNRDSHRTMYGGPDCGTGQSYGSRIGKCCDGTNIRKGFGVRTGIH